MVIAATLMAIKSRSLLPREEVELEDELDPEDELIQRLLEYRRFKGAADDLEDRLARRTQEHFRGFQNEANQYKGPKTLDMGELTAFDLLAAFSRLMRETLAAAPIRSRATRAPALVTCAAWVRRSRANGAWACATC
ncbi:MAG: segregation/condensation protein A [Planctomycetota bacterium]